MGVEPAGELTWHVGRLCESGACIEVAALGETVMMRSSVDADGRSLSVSRNEWQAFLDGVKDGRFDEV